MLAAIRVRGSVKADARVEDTMRMLRLTRANHCTLLHDNPTSIGMLRKAGGWLTWGHIDQDTLEKLIARKGRVEGDRKLDRKEALDIAKKIGKSQSLDGIAIKRVFRLSPPSRGYKSVKLPYPRGALGDRGEKINELIKRMI